MDWDDARYEEVKRRVDHQVQDVQEYQRQAAFFLRISIATIGIAITALTYSDLGNTVISTLTKVLSLDLAEVTKSLTNDAPHMILFSSTVVGLLSIFGIVSTMVVVGLVGMYIPRNAYKAAYPRQTERGMDVDAIENIENPQSFDVEGIFERYQSQISHNQPLVNEKRRYLQQCFNGTGIAIGAAVVSSICFYFLTNPSLIGGLIGLSIVITLMYFYAQKENPIAGALRQFGFSKLTDLPIILSSVAMLLLYKPGREDFLLVLIGFVLLIHTAAILPFHTWQKSKSQIINEFSRMAVLLVVWLTFVFVFLEATPIVVNTPLVDRVLLTMIIALLGMVLSTLSLSSVLAIRQSVMFTQSVYKNRIEPLVD